MTSQTASRLLKWSARGVFVIAIVVAVVSFRDSRAVETTPPTFRQPDRQPVEIDWAARRTNPWSDKVVGVTVEAPEGWTPIQVFERFTKRPVADVTAYDVVAFRSASPRSVIAIVRYAAKKPLSWDDWRRRVETPLRPLTQRKLIKGAPPPPLSEEFGATDVKIEEGRLGSRRALWIKGQAAETFQMRGNYEVDLWRYRSVFIAEGAQAIRMTYGAEVRQLPGLVEGFDRCLESLTWTPTVQPGT